MPGDGKHSDDGGGRGRVHGAPPSTHRSSPQGAGYSQGQLLGGLAYAGISSLAQTSAVGERPASGVILFLGLALLIALGFEFVNGFHDTAIAVATVIYT